MSPHSLFPINHTYNMASLHPMYERHHLKTYYPSVHQPSLAARPRTYLLQTGSPQLWRIDPSTAPLRATYSHVSPAFPTWHPDDGCGLLLHIVWTFRRFVSLQAAVSGFGCHRLERPASPRRICAVTRRFFRQRLKTFLFSERHYHMTHVNTITIQHYCLDSLPTHIRNIHTHTLLSVTTWKLICLVALDD